MRHLVTASTNATSTGSVFVTLKPLPLLNVKSCFSAGMEGDDARKEHRPRQAGAKVNKAKAAALKKDPSRKNAKSIKVRKSQCATVCCTQPHNYD